MFDINDLVIGVNRVLNNEVLNAVSMQRVGVGWGVVYNYKKGTLRNPAILPNPESTSHN